METPVPLQYLGNQGPLDIFPVYSLEVMNPNYLSMDGAWNWNIDPSRSSEGNMWGTVSDVSGLPSSTSGKICI